MQLIYIFYIAWKCTAQSQCFLLGLTASRKLKNSLVSCSCRLVICPWAACKCCGEASRGNPSSGLLVRVEQRTAGVHVGVPRAPWLACLPADTATAPGRGASIPAVPQVLCRLLLICKKNRHLPYVEERLSFPPGIQGLDPCFTARHLLWQTAWAPAWLRMLHILVIHSHTGRHYSWVPNNTSW